MENNGMEDLQERIALARTRVREIREEKAVHSRVLPYFRREAEYITDVFSWREKDLLGLSEEENRAWQDRLFGELRDDYACSFLNPDYAEKQLGTYGKVLSFVAAELNGLPAYLAEAETITDDSAFSEKNDEEASAKINGEEPAAGEKRRNERKLLPVAAVLELFLEIYSLFLEEEHPHLASLEKAVRYYALDYVEAFEEMRAEETYVPSRNLAYHIVMEKSRGENKTDLKDTRYLYLYGEYISDNERRLAQYLEKLPEEEIRSMAETFTRGFRRGFDTMQIDFTGKNSVSIRYHIGQERLVRAVIRSFGELGLSCILHRYAVSRLNRRLVRLSGFESTPASRQFIFDHRMDDALFLTPRYASRKIGAVERAYRRLEKELRGYAGPAVIETFGEALFAPEIKESAPEWTEEETELDRRIVSETGLISEKYLPGDSFSFSIIAYPLPEIGKDFEKIFAETVRLNTLSNAEYLPVQQAMIDVLDRADHVHVTGRNGNRTDIRVKLRRLESPEKETQFENCVADVNIPLGEVFTSPVLKGTNGILHVSFVYLNGYQFKDLAIRFADGVTADFSCGNFPDPEDGRRYILDNILFRHPFLPMGEFAIGTNTAAYKMAKTYRIFEQLPILIMEKTGPHFAVGDTCYSHAEDKKVYNPDGKEIISRENDFSLLRDTEPERAYFNCHTDITIPYDELGRVTAVMQDGKEVDIIREGRYVLPGTEMLNAYLN